MAKTSEIVNAYVNNIMGLPTVIGENPREVEEFYKRLLYDVQSLETLGKLRDVAGNVRAVLDKLKGIKSDSVRGHEQWQEWDFRQLLQAIKHWKDINPVTEASESEIQPREPTYIPKRENVKNDGFLHQRSYQTRQDVRRHMHGCVCRDKTGHFSANFPKVTSVGDCKKILSQQQNVLIALVTDTELKAVEAADVTTVNASITHRFVTRQTMQVSEDFRLHKTNE